MPRRIFIAVNLPEKIRKELYSFRDDYPDLPLRWTRKDDLHLTLLFLGHVNDDELLNVCDLVKEVGRRHPPFSLSLKRIVFGPPSPRRSRKGGGGLRLGYGAASPPQKPPRLIWVEGQASKKLSQLQQDLESSLFENVAEDRDEETHGFRPHITLARIKQWQWHQLEPEEIPEIDKEISFTFLVGSIEVMESELKKEGPEYTILESFQLSS